VTEFWNKLTTTSAHLRRGRLAYSHQGTYPDTQWSALAPFAALFMLVTACTALGLQALAREVDRSDADRTREAVVAAFNYQVKRIEAGTLNNAVYTAAARAVGGSKVDRDWAHENWSVSPVGLPGYHGVFLIDFDGRPLAGTRAGRPLGDHELERLARLARPISRRLPLYGEAARSGVINTASGPVMVAAANVVPEPPDRAADFMLQPRRRFVLVHPVDDAVLTTIDETIGGDGLRIGEPSGDAASVRITTASGSPVTLSWQSHKHGADAMRRSLLQISPVFILATLLLVHAMRTSLASHRALERLANIDQLTGLANRASFMRHLEGRLAREQTVALGLVDLDGFKLVNDSYGHLAGDDVLVGFARLLTLASAQGDIVGRLGGDEFAFISQDEASGERLVSRLHVLLGEAIAERSLEHSVGASVGIAMSTLGMSARDLIADADTRLYHDKKRRREPAPSQAEPVHATRAALASHAA
jgi:diguanylate cyclase (GGDEF)-like protein